MIGHTNSPRAIAKRLFALMRASDMTPDDVGRITGVSSKRVVEWMKGECIPPRRCAKRLAEQTGVTLAWIYYGDRAGLSPQQTIVLGETLAGKGQ